MTHEQAWVRRSLRRVALVLVKLGIREVVAVEELIVRLRTPPVKLVRRPRQVVVRVLPGLGCPLPSPPKARPLLTRLNGHKTNGTNGHGHHLPQEGAITFRKTQDTPPDPVGEQAAQASGARSLLLEIIRRAAFDWVLYRTSRRLDQKFLAEDAYTWIFLEDENHPNWKIRKAEGKLLTSFLNICEQLDVDAERLRKYIRHLTPNRVMSSGRPPENSRPGDSTPDIEIHADVPDSSGAYDFDMLLMPFDLLN